MKTNDNLLKRKFVLAIDEVIPPAPWLENRVIDMVRRNSRPKRRTFGLAGLFVSLPSFRIAAQLMALLLVFAVIAAVLINAHLHTQTVPSRKGHPVPSVSPSAAQPEVPWNPPDSAFIPEYDRSPSWPPGGPVPDALTGAWQPQVHELKTGVLELGGYSFLIMIITGNVVVNGSEIDFIVDWCGIGRYRYTLTGDTLVLRKIGSDCGLLYAGTYTRLPAGVMTNTGG